MDESYFYDAILNLKKRAASARRTRSIIASVLFLLSLLIFGIIYINTTSGLAKGMSDVYKKLSSNNNDRIATDAEKFVSNTFRDMYLSNKNNPSDSKVKVDDSIKKDNNGFLLQASQDDFERMVKSVEVRSKLLDSYTDWKGARYRLGSSEQSLINSVTTSVATIAFSLCSMILLLFLVQISLMFMRYYAQLAELYDSQALALIVSEGNADKAILFAKEFSPKVISIGKSPESVYEKAFDIIGNAINKKEV